MNQTFFARPKRGRKFQINKHDYTRDQAMILIKKILIYFILALHLFRLFLEIKTEGQYKPIVPDVVNKTTLEINLKIMENSMAKKEVSELFQIDLVLLRMSVRELVEAIDIKLFQHFVNISQVVFRPDKDGNGGSQRKFFLNGDNYEVNFQGNDFEIDEILCAKRKRGDEGLKHCFKAIRKGIFKVYREKNKSGRQLTLMKDEFNDYVFGKDERMKGYFRENNITKETISNLKRCQRFEELSEGYKSDSFLKDQVNRNILDKKEEILSKNMTFEDFAKVLLDKQKKHGWILQNILNSIEMYDACTKDIKPRRRKRSRKKKKPVG